MVTRSIDCVLTPRLRDTIDQSPDRMLMLLDNLSGGQTHAAVAVGNPDTADHVSVTTPGLNTTVGGAIGAMTKEGEQVKSTAESQLDDTADRKGETVSTIAWIGYDATQLDNDDYFYEGIDASNHDGDPHLTAVGHSYGSFTTGLALQETPEGIVDDLVMACHPMWRSSLG